MTHSGKQESNNSKSLYVLGKMIFMSIQKDLSELVHNGLISDEQSDAINAPVFRTLKKANHISLKINIIGNKYYKIG